MDLLSQIKKDKMKAMMKKDNITKTTLMLLVSSIDLKRGRLGRELTNNEIYNVVKSELKKNKEILLITKDRAKVEKEINILQGLLPEQLSENEIRESLKTLIDSLDEVNMGKVMSGAKDIFGSSADMKLVSGIAKELI